jgi:hypothetical protein
MAGCTDATQADVDALEGKEKKRQERSTIEMIPALLVT